MPPVTKFYRCLGSGERIPSTKIGDNIVGITAQCYQLLFCFSFQVDCNDASDERSLVTDVQRDEEMAAIEETIVNMYEMNKVNGITTEKKVDGGGDKEELGHNLIIGDGGGVKERRDVEQQSSTIDVVNKSLLTGQPPSSSYDCYGFDDGDWVALLLFGKLLKKLFLGKNPDGMFYLGVLASKKIADETRKYVKERARNAGTTLCGFTRQRLRDYFWLEETRADNEESGAAGDISAAIELEQLTEKPLMRRKKIKVKRVAVVAANKSTTTTDTEKVIKGSTETLPPLPASGSSSSDEDET
jgi:hypothetical protein